MESLPVDLNHPAVRDYLSLVRLQVLTPLSLLINIVSILVCTLVARPSIGGVSELYPTSISPKPVVIAAYVIAIYIGQVGYCLLLVFALKAETKRTLVKGVGISLVLANWVMALWAVCWVFQFFLASTILQGILLLLLIYANIVLLIYHAPTSSRPFDTALIHAPLRFFLILPLSLLFPISLFITLHLNYRSGTPEDKTRPLPGFLVVLITNLLGLLVIAIRRDIVWCVAAVWVCAGIWTQGTRPALIFITVIVFTVLHPLVLIGSMMWGWFSRKQDGRRGPISLPPDGEDAEETPNRARRAREIDAEVVWG